MVSKKNFQQNGRLMLQHRPAGNRRGPGPYKKLFKPHDEAVGPNLNEMMFSAVQIPDNPGFMDFNNPTPPINGPSQSTPPPNISQQKKKNNKNKQKNKQPSPIPPQRQNGNAKWSNPKVPPHQQMGHINKRMNAGGMPRRFHSAPAVGPHAGRRMIQSMIPTPGIGPGGGPRNGMMPPPIPPRLPIPPPMARGLPPPPPLPPQGMFLRRNIRGPMRMPPPPMLPMMMGPPRMPLGIPPLPIPNPVGKIKKPNIKMVKKAVKSKSTIKTLKNLINQYPLDKPWVTSEIRSEHDKKVEIENKLKGNKDDDLFAQFKTQRDKFVAMYEAAREEYLKQEAAAVKTKDAKDKQTNTKTDAKDENNEAN